MFGRFVALISAIIWSKRTQKTIKRKHYEQHSFSCHRYPKRHNQNYKDVIDDINQAIHRAVKQNFHVVYIRHENLSPGTKTFKPGTKGTELPSDLEVVSSHIFIKSKSNALTSPEFVNFVAENAIEHFYIAGADATVCVKSTCFNMCKAKYDVTVLSDCITSWNKKQINDMLRYYESVGCKTIKIRDLLR